MSQTLTKSPQGDIIDATVVSPRAALISQSLKSMARRARTPRSLLGSTGQPVQRRWQRTFVWAILAGFVIVVLVPNLVASIYLAFVTSNQYATETRFAVRTTQSSVLSSLGGLVGIPSIQEVQDSLILVDYIDGPSMVRAVDQALDLRHLFARRKIDFFSRLNPKDSNEELLNYWQRHVDTNIDSMSGIITVVVRAFTPEDSFNITNKIISSSEQLVNDLTERSRQDALRQARAELERANQNLRTKSVALRNLRNSDGVLDTGKTGDIMSNMLGQLRLELIGLEQDYATQRSSVLPSAPQLRVLQARIDSMKDQISRLKSEMTGVGHDGAPVLSDIITRFDRAKLEKQIAEKEYTAAAAAFERARVELETKHVYLATFLKPVLAQEALYPKRLWLWSIVAIISLAIWLAGVGIAMVVRNHVAL